MPGAVDMDMNNFFSTFKSFLAERSRETCKEINVKKDDRCYDSCGWGEMPAGRKDSDRKAFIIGL